MNISENFLNYVKSLTHKDKPPISLAEDSTHITLKAEAPTIPVKSLTQKESKKRFPTVESRKEAEIEAPKLGCPTCGFWTSLEISNCPKCGSTLKSRQLLVSENSQIS